MTRASKRALERYPVIKRPSWSRSCGWSDQNERKRKIYREAYQQAEKDLALTIEDIELLHTFLYAVKNNKQGVFTFTRLSNEQYEEVLRRFREMKNK